MPFTRTLTSQIPSTRSAMQTHILAGFTSAGFSFSTVTIGTYTYYYQTNIPIPNSTRTLTFAIRFNSAASFTAFNYLEVGIGEGFDTGTGTLTSGSYFSTIQIANGEPNTSTVVVDAFAPGNSDSGRFRFVRIARTGGSDILIGYIMPYINTYALYNSSNHNLSILIQQTATNNTTFTGTLLQNASVLPFSGATTFTTTTSTYTCTEPAGATYTFFFPIYAFYTGNGGQAQIVPIGHLGSDLRFASAVNSTYLQLDQTASWLNIGANGNTGGLYIKIA